MKVTIKDIAKMADVSVATVSRVVNNKSKGVSEETRKRILDIVEEYHYQPSAVARGLVTKKSKIIGLIVPDIANPFYSRLAKGVEDGANENGYDVILCDGKNSTEKEAYYLGFLNEHYVSGIIYNNFHNISDATLNSILQSRLPLVFIDSKVDLPGCSCVYIDNQKAMYEVISYLISLGHEKIGFISGPMDSYSSDERYKGYLKALEDHNIPVDEHIIAEGGYVYKEGYKAMEHLLEQNVHMTAVVCCNDLMAVGALQKLEEENISVPEDLSLVGFDNIDITRFVRPRLTTVEQPIFEMGKEAAYLMIDIIEGKSSFNNNYSKIFDHKLILRDSVEKIG